MEYKLPDLPEAYGVIESAPLRTECAYSADQMRQYAEQAVAPLLAEIERLKEFAAEEYDRGHEQGYESCYESMRDRE